MQPLPRARVQQNEIDDFFAPSFARLLVIWRRSWRVRGGLRAAQVKTVLSWPTGALSPVGPAALQTAPAAAPGKLCYAKRPGVKGTDVKCITRVRIGRVVRCDGTMVWFQDPYHLRDKRRIFASKNFTASEVPLGMTAMQFLGQEQPELRPNRRSGGCVAKCLARSGSRSRIERLGKWN